ncbi:HAD hydrolase family protein [Alteromonas sp. a30]|uniref:HAD hydrolase family protein n=1 Tax=Alteromonas sp. a30 TaxID=2730917 RepID=UPI00228301D2|nr:HAD hydrolase family protein [Alteromonas sp. a30]MCY7296200.1 HAD hydrolase family protein [Alteromonas sp. a30]
MNQINRKKLQQFITELVKQEGLPPNSVFAIETAFLLWQTEITHDEILSQKPKPPVQQIAQIEYIFFGFNGVLTNNKVYIDSKGDISVRCDQSDLRGIKQLRSIGKLVSLLSSGSDVVSQSAAEFLSVDLFDQCIDKAGFLREWMKKNGVEPQQVAYVGSGEHDVGAMQQVGLKLCPADAESEIIAIADYVIPCLGGEGIASGVAELFKVDLSDNQPLGEFA